MVIYQSFVEEKDDQKFKTQTTKNGASRPWTKKTDENTGSGYAPGLFPRLKLGLHHAHARNMSLVQG
jgi:hypothetical protein